MESGHGLVSLPQVRERVIQQLTEAFAQDLISVEELEHRLEHVYRAQSAAETEAIVVDLRSAAATGSLPGPNADEPRQSRDLAPDVPTRDRFVAILSSSSRRGPLSVPHRLEALAVFSDSVIDLTAASLPADIVDIHVRIVMANMKIVIPAGLRVVNRVGAFLANVETDAALDLAPMVPGAPVIRITGYATLANLEIVAAPSGSGPF
jgi:Domain of unknown function (DUF1707)